MTLDLADYESAAKRAVMAFWSDREKARQKQTAEGKADQGERGTVTAGKNLDQFIALMENIVKANGLGEAAIHRKRRVVTLPLRTHGSRAAIHNCLRDRIVANGR